MLVAVNVIDDLEYRVRANVGPAIFRQMPRRSFLVGRVVPVGTQWLLSGVSARFPTSERARLMRLAAGMALTLAVLAVVGSVDAPHGVATGCGWSPRFVVSRSDRRREWARGRSVQRA
ncbi:MAG: hypothetical protein ACRDRA_06955 [Pseudonocardiaceae bacterium]